MPWNLNCDPWVSWSFFYKTTIIRPLTKSKFHGIKYIYLIYIYLLLLYYIIDLS